MKGYIVKKDGKWYIVQMMNYVGYEPHWSTAVEIHPSHLTGIEQYEGKEVEYGMSVCACIDAQDKHSCKYYNYENKCSQTTYAIPILSDKVDAWEEARLKCKNALSDKTHLSPSDIVTDTIEYLKQHYQLTKKQ